MGRFFFAAILTIVGLMYVGLAVAAVFSPATPGTADPVAQGIGLLLFLVIGVAAGLAGFNVLREKRR